MNRPNARIRCERCNKPFGDVDRYRMVRQKERTSRGRKGSQFSSDGWVAYLCERCADAVEAKVEAELRGGCDDWSD